MMADILFNAQGVPLLASGRSYLGATTGVPADKPNSANPKPSKIDLDRTIIGNYEICQLGIKQRLALKSRGDH